MGKGRPTKSEIRQNMVELLNVIGEAYGYSLYKSYMRVFPKVTMRSIYYHLKKGLELGEFKISKIQKEQGQFSWGGEVQKTYYALGENAKPEGNQAVKDHFDNLKKPVSRND